MKAAIIILCIFFIGQLNAQEVSKNLLQGQNIDGSFGAKNREVVTAVVTYTMLLNEVNHSKLKSMIGYLNKSVSRLKTEEVDERHLYVFWALCGVYECTGDESGKKTTKELFEYIIQGIYPGGKANFGKVSSPENLGMMIRSMRSAVKLGFSDGKLIDLMEDLCGAVLSKSGFKGEVPFALHLISRVWGIKHFKAAQDRSVDATRIQKYLTGLNSNSSKVRKKTLLECKKLSMGKMATLVFALKNSEVLELQLVGEELGVFCMISSTLPNSLPSFENVSINWLNLYSSYSFTYHHHKRKGVQKTLDDFMNYVDSGDPKNFNYSIPGVVKGLSKFEHEKVVSSFVFEMRRMHRNIVSMRAKKWSCLIPELKVDIMEEEGLDLVD